MHIGWVGGILRARDELVMAAAAAGHSLEFHMGDTRGRGAAGLEGMIARSDVVIINIEINSHGGALLAKKYARRMGRRSIIVRKPSVSALNRALVDLKAA
jgi:hypothetical protein